MSGIYSSGPGSPHAERDTTLRDLLAVVFRRKWLIIGIFTVACLLIGVRTLTSPVTFSADATLLLKRQGARSSVLEQRGNTLPWVEVVESEVEVLQSMPVLQRAQEKLREPTEAHPEGLRVGLNGLSKSIKSGVIGESNILYVTGTADTRAAAVAITNAVAESYVEYHAELFRLPEAGELFQARADSTISTIDQLQQRRAQLLGDIGVTQIVDQEKLQINHRENRRAELTALERQMAKIRTEIEDSRKFLDQGNDLLPFESSTFSIQGNSVKEITLELRRKRTQLEQYLVKYTEAHPLVRETRGDVEKLRKDLEKGVSELLAAKEHELRVVRSEAEVLRSEIAAIDKQLARLPELVREIESIDTRIKSLSDQYAELSEQAVDTEIRQSTYADYSVQVLSPAVGAQQNAKGDMVRLALGPILALMAGIGLAFYLENLDHSLGNREDVERHLEIPVLASFPDVELEETTNERTTKIPYQGGRKT